MRNAHQCAAVQSPTEEKNISVRGDTKTNPGQQSAPEDYGPPNWTELTSAQKPEQSFQCLQLSQAKISCTDGYVFRTLFVLMQEVGGQVGKYVRCRRQAPSDL